MGIPTGKATGANMINQIVNAIGQMLLILPDSILIVIIQIREAKAAE